METGEEAGRDAGREAEGASGAAAGGATGLAAGGAGKYRGPVCPQPSSRPKTTAVVPILSANEDFTIRITD